MTIPLFSYLPYGTAEAAPLQIKLGSRSGWYDDSAEIQTANNSEYVGEIISQITYGKRALSFQCPVYASSADNLQTEIRNICALFRPTKQPGRLYYKDERYINVHPSGTPSVTDVSETFAWVTISLTAVNPFWYDAETPTVYNSGDTITNAGTYDAEVSFTAAANTITLSVGGTVTHTITARSGQSLSGCVFTISDNSISVLSGTTNALWKADISSQYFLIPVGQSVITGANNITIKQRWNGA